jgi:Secretion system C-terminal sorting domain
MKYLYLFCLIIISNFVFSQQDFDFKRDYVWIMGSGGPYNGIEISKSIFLDFKNDTMALSFKEAQGDDFHQTNASICDTAGNFLFYSNGCVLADSIFQYIEGADTINKGVRWNSICGGDQHLTDGYVIVNGCWIIPVAENKFKTIYVDHFNNLDNQFTSGIRYTTVLRDPITGNLSGSGVDEYLYNQSVDPTKRAFVRHGNGRDWWLINSKNGTKTHYAFLIDSTNNVYAPIANEFEELPNLEFNTSGQACFSPDGDIYASFDYANHCLIYDFNRCNGEMSNLRIVKPLLSSDSIVAITGIAISPNSHFLYLMTNFIITQYDLQSDNIGASAIIVAVKDNWVGTTSLGNPDYPPTFYQSQLGPDGKIYVFNAAGRRTFAVIESPDSLGLACNVIQHKYNFPQWGVVRQPPRFPNYRLGAMVGSPCDTIVYTSATSVTRPQASMKLLPNPATDYTVADISVSDYSENQQLILSVVDVSGREVKRKSVSAYTSLQRIETRDLKAGLYFVQLYVRGNVVVVNKLIVAHE